MTAAYCIALLWTMFILTHLGVSSSGLRVWLVHRFGVRAYVVSYALIAAAQLGAIGWAVATLSPHDSASTSLNTSFRYALYAVSALGALLIAGGLVGYARSPMAVLARHARMPRVAARIELAPPSPIERITRHPFFVGVALLMSAHALLASTPAQALYFLGYAVLALLGIVMQDRRLRRAHGETYQPFLDRTSALPLAALGRAPALRTRDALRALLIAMIGAALLWLLHPLWQWRNGAGFAFATAVFGLIALARQMHASMPPPQTNAPPPM